LLGWSGPLAGLQLIDNGLNVGGNRGRLRSGARNREQAENEYANQDQTLASHHCRPFENIA
jgi:hypothetical protein